MNKIKIIDAEDITHFFEIPWDWITQDGLAPILNDLEASAERGKTTGYLYRNRMAEIPEYVLSIVKTLKQSEIYPLLQLIRKVKVKVYYFDIWSNAYVNREFYVPKPRIKIKKIANDPQDLLVSPFEINFKGYRRC